MSEAAERLRDFVRAYVRSDKRLALIDEALAAERKATVERIAAVVDAAEVERFHFEGEERDYLSLDGVRAILDAEAER